MSAHVNTSSRSCGSTPTHPARSDPVEVVVVPDEPCVSHVASPQADDPALVDDVVALGIAGRGNLKEIKNYRFVVVLPS